MLQFQFNQFANIGRGLVNPLLLRYGTRSNYDLRNSLVITGFPRSGTTWLAEIAAGLPQTAVLFEPCNFQAVPQAAAAGMDWDNFRMPDENWPEGERFFEQALSGRVINRWTTSDIPLNRAIHVRRWVVKFVRINQMLGWLTDRFPIRPPVLLVRHPCAVFDSWVSRGWPMLSCAHQNPRFMQAYPELQRIVGRLTTAEEFFAAKWCMEHYHTLRVCRPGSYQLVYYERLRADPMGELAKIFGCWQVPPPQNLPALVSKPSARTSRRFAAASNDRSSEKQGWRHRLPRASTDQIMAVVSAFGINLYTGARCSAPAG